MAYELVHYAVSGGVATITLDSPHNRNALSAQLRRELRDHLSTAEHDDAARVIVLDHTGPVFCAGMDLKEAGGASTSDPGGGGSPSGGRNEHSVNEFPAILEQ